MSESLIPCKYCGRKFSPEAIQRHSKICQKVNTKNRKVFDSSKQRQVAENHTKFSKTKKSNDNVAKSSKSNWKQKHENFIQTVRAARGVTTAIKEGKPLPPPPPATINPDYIQCPHCSRRFNQNAAERHIKFCAEQSKRIQPKQKISEAVKARTSYKPPLPTTKPNLNKMNRNPNPKKPIQPTVSGRKPPVIKGANRRSKQPGWNDTIDPSNSSYQKNRSRTGLKPAIIANSREVNTKESKQVNKPAPVVRKVARQVSSKQYKLESNHVTSQPYYSDVKKRNYTDSNAPPISEIPNYGSRDDSYNPTMFATNGRTRSYEVTYKANNNSSAGALRHNKEFLARKYCQECGCKYPVVTAKFCCECGFRRLSFDE